LVYVSSLLSTQYWGERAKTGWLRIRITCPAGRHVYPRTVVTVSYHYTYLTKHVDLVQSDLIIISLKFYLFPSWFSWKLTELALSNNHSLTHSFRSICFRLVFYGIHVAHLYVLCLWTLIIVCPCVSLYIFATRLCFYVVQHMRYIILCILKIDMHNFYWDSACRTRISNYSMII
jgi:hypothetical protein